MRVAIARDRRRRRAAPPSERGVEFLGVRGDDGTRTRNPHLAKVMRYQLRHVPGAQITLAQDSIVT